ncbi:MAG: ATP-grasp domain-containing protein [Beijerinckiaceae bacterium]
MKRSVLLTLGRLPKGLDIARSFAQAGWRVIVADPHKRHVVGASRAVEKSYRVPAPSEAPNAYLNALAEVIAAERVELVVPISEEILHAAALRERLPPDVRLFAMPQATLLRLHDKAGFVRFAEAHELRVPETELSGSAEALQLAARDDYVVKLRHTCAGAGLIRGVAGRPPPSVSGAVVQRMVRGVEHSACAIAHAGYVQACAVYRGSLVSGTVAVGFERVDHPAILEWVGRFVAVSDWTGFISFDFIVDADGAPWALECNPRLTSGVHFFETQDIARAILHPGAAVRFRRERRLQQMWACVTETQNSFGDWPRFRKNLRHLFSTRDVSWSMRDPWPLVGMPWTAWTIISQSRALKISFGEAASSDIVWRSP